MEKCPDEMNFFNSFVDKGLKERLEHVAASDFGRVSYTEAVEILKKNNDKFDYKVEWGCDLQTEHERYLTEQVYKQPGVRHRLPQGDQGLLYAPERRRQDRGRRRLPGARHRRDHRRLPARGAAGRAGGAHGTSWAWTPRTTGGTWTCGATAPAATPASAWASSGW